MTRTVDVGRGGISDNKQNHSGGGIMQTNQLFSFMTFGVALATVFSSNICRAEFFEKLTDDQKQQILDGKQVTAFEDVDGEIWPKTMAWQKIDSTPEQAVAIASDYSRQHEYVYRIVGSEPYEISGNSTKVHYKMNLTKIRFVPDAVLKFFTDPNYDLEQKVNDPKNGVYECDWKLVAQTGLLSRTEGRAVYEALPGSQGTMVYYENFVTPNVSGFFGRLKKIAMKADSSVAAVKRGGGEALQTIVDHINDVVKTDPSYVEGRVLQFRKGLADSAANTN